MRNRKRGMEEMVRNVMDIREVFLKIDENEDE